MPNEIEPTDIAAQEEAQQRQADEAHLRRLQEVDDLKWLLSDKRGRRVFWRLLSLTHVFHTSFRLNNEMAFLEGERNIGLKLWAEMHEHVPEAYLQMVKEQRANGQRNTGDRDHRNKR